MKRPPSAREFKVRFLTCQALLPEQLCQDVLLIQNENQPLIDTNFLRLQIIPLAEAFAEDEDTLIEVSYFLPASESLENTEANLECFEKRHELIESYLRKLFPFSQDRLRRLYPLIGVTQEDLFDNPADDYTRFLQEAARDSHFSPSYNYPSFITPYQNLLALGQDQMSWLGMAGRLQSATKTANYIWGRESKRKPV
jgi:hypothetical protein